MMTIKEIINNPALDKNYILKMQKKMLEAERNRLNQLIDSIEAALKGAEMDFTVFTREESVELFEAMLTHIPKEMRDAAIKEFGSLGQWREHYLDAVSKEKVQRQYAKVVEWYGEEEPSADCAAKPFIEKIRESYQRRIEKIYERLNQRRALDVNSFEIRELIGEYGFVTKQLYQLKEEKGMMLSQAESLMEKKTQEAVDEKYGAGFAAFFADAIKVFYEG